MTVQEMIDRVCNGDTAASVIHSVCEIKSRKAKGFVFDPQNINRADLGLRRKILDAFKHPEKYTHQGAPLEVTGGGVWLMNSDTGEIIFQRDTGQFASDLEKDLKRK